jgi:hypothetical protein
LSVEVIHAACVDIVQIASPIIVVVLNALELGDIPPRELFSLIDELTHVKNWTSAGTDGIVKLPYIAALAYHHILGSFLIQSQRHTNAFDLLVSKIRYQDSRMTELWRAHEVMGYATSLGRRNNLVFPFVTGLYKSQRWINRFFSNEDDFIDSLRSYLCLASILELADFIWKGGVLPPSDGISFDVPPMFVKSLEIQELSRIVRRAVPDSDLVEMIAKHSGVRAEDLRKAWPAWMQAIFNWYTYPHENPIAGILDRTSSFPRLP